MKKKTKMMEVILLAVVIILSALSCYYLWKINHVPEGLELRSWFRISCGCFLILFWQIFVIICAVIISKLLRPKIQSQFLRIFFYICVFLLCGCIILYLTWNFVGISIANDKDSENPNGTLTVYRDRDLLKPDDYSYFLYEKEGLLYRRYLRDMCDENDYSVLDNNSKLIRWSRNLLAK